MQNKKKIEPSYVHLPLPTFNKPVRWYTVTHALEDGTKLSVEYCVYWRNKQRHMIIREVAGMQVHIFGVLQNEARVSTILSNTIVYTAIRTAELWLENKLSPHYR